MDETTPVPASPAAPVEKRAAANKKFEKADDIFPFGPSFFMKHLGRFLREFCKQQPGKQARVILRLGDGTSLEVCHIVGVAPQWVIVAVDRDSGPREQIAVEFVPYDLIRRVEMTTRPGEQASIGFSQTRTPEVIAPEPAVTTPIVEPAGPGTSSTPELT